jgi:hypothetical protein
MRYVGFGLWIKPDICFQDILSVCDLVRQAQNQSLWLRYLHYKKVVQIFTTGHKVRWYHVFLIRRVLTAADMLSDEKVDYDPKRKIEHFVNWLAPRLRMSAREIITQYNISSLAGFYREALAYHFKRDVSFALAQHAPVKFHEMIEQLYDYRRAEIIEARNAEIEETINDPDQRQIDNITSRLGYDGEFHG